MQTPDVAYFVKAARKDSTAARMFLIIFAASIIDNKELQNIPLDKILEVAGTTPLSKELKGAKDKKKLQKILQNQEEAIKKFAKYINNEFQTQMPTESQLQRATSETESSKLLKSIATCTGSHVNIMLKQLANKLDNNSVHDDIKEFINNINAHETPLLVENPSSIDQLSSTRLKPEMTKVEANEQSKRCWATYSTLPVDFVNEQFTDINKDISVCFQPNIGEKGFLIKISDAQYIYTMENDTNGSSINFSNEKTQKNSPPTREEKKEDDKQKGDKDSNQNDDQDTDKGSSSGSTLENVLKSQNQLKLSELHTHLMGMGNSDFWINFIMKELIPKQIKDKPIHTVNLDSWNFEELDLDFDMCLCGGEYTNDVVYSLNDLCIAFELDDNRSLNEKEALVTKIIGHTPKYYGIKNEREGKQEIRYGFTNTQIIQSLECKNQFSLLEHKLERAFEMERPGDYNGKFTPNFYPQRFILKDSMYTMYPEILSAILLHTILQYSSGNVEYVEYSVSIKDLKQEHISRHLKPNNLVLFWNNTMSTIYNNSQAFEVNYEQTTDTLTVNGTNFYYYFLAALNRNAIALFNESDKDDEAKMNKYQNLKLETAFKREVFAKTLNQIGQSATEEINQKKIEKLLDDLDISTSVQLGSVVGFDWVGDEKYFAPCVFVLDDFNKIAAAYYERVKSPLGLRYHCGENVFIDKNLKYFLKHMEITFHSIRKILENDKVKLRLGHGVGFLLVRGTGPFVFEHNNELKRIDGVFERMKRFREFLYDHDKKLPKVWFEWCPTSNEYLLFDFHQICLPFNTGGLVVATDNDGIMPVEGLEAETKKAVDKLVKMATFADLVTESRKARFVDLIFPTLD